MLLLRQSGSRISHIQGAKAISPGIADRRFHTHVRPDAGSDDLIDASLPQELLEFRLPERGVSCLGDNRIFRPRLQIVQNFYVPGPSDEAFVVFEVRYGIS